MIIRNVVRTISSPLPYFWGRCETFPILLNFDGKVKIFWFLVRWLWEWFSLSIIVCNHWLLLRVRNSFCILNFLFNVFLKINSCPDWFLKQNAMDFMNNNLWFKALPRDSDYSHRKYRTPPLPSCSWKVEVCLYYQWLWRRACWCWIQKQACRWWVSHNLERINDKFNFTVDITCFLPS